MAVEIRITSLNYPSSVRKNESFTISISIKNVGDSGNFYASIFNRETREYALFKEGYLAHNGTKTYSATTSISSDTRFWAGVGETLPDGRHRGTDGKDFKITVTEAPPPPPPSPPPPSPPPKICTPGEHKCVGGDLYVCNSDGTKWILQERNSPICKETGGCPSFWTDPIGAVVCWIISFIEQALNLIAGGFLTLLSNVKNFLDNFSTGLADFIRDPIGHVRAWVSDIIPTLRDWWGDIFQGVNNWWDNTKTAIGEWWSDSVKAVGEWIDNGFKNIGDWWNNTKKVVGDWWSDRIKAVGDWIDSGFKNIGDWWNNTKKVVGDWWSDTIKNIGELFTEKFIAFIKWVEGLPKDVDGFIRDRMKDVERWWNDNAPGMVEGMFEWAKPIVDPIINAANWLGQLLGILTGAYPQDPRIEETQEKVDQEKEEIENIIAGLE